MDKFKEAMKHEFDISDLRLMGYFLGIEFIQSDSWFFSFQSRYSMDMLKRFKMNSKPRPTPITTR